MKVQTLEIIKLITKNNVNITNYKFVLIKINNNSYFELFLMTFNIKTRTTQGQYLINLRGKIYSFSMYISFDIIIH